MTMGYCMSCRKKKEMKDAKPVKMKNGRPAMEGRCGTCGGRMYVIGGK